MTEQKERFIEWADKEFGRLPTLSMQICQTERFASYYKCFKAAEAPLLERIAELERQLAEKSQWYRFENANIIGSVDQDLNKYRCPSCSSPFFIRGSHSYLQYVQCAKTNCQRVDIIGPAILAAGGDVR